MGRGVEEIISQRCWAEGSKLTGKACEPNRGRETAMTIAVIGATGNTGRAVVKELRALGQNPVCVVKC